MQAQVSKHTSKFISRSAQSKISHYFASTSLPTQQGLGSSIFTPRLFPTSILASSQTFHTTLPRNLCGQVPSRKLHGSAWPNFRHRYQRSGQPEHVPEEYLPKPDWPVVSIIAANVGVFALWQIHGNDSAVMRRYFTMTIENMEQGRWWTMIIAMFSHMGLGHLLTNMITLHVLGSEVCRSIGPSKFAALYLVGGGAASAAHLLFTEAYTVPQYGERAKVIPALGASGSVMAIGSLFAILWPYRKLSLFGIIPFSAGTLMGLMVLSDLLFITKPDGVGHSAHLGGAAVGAIYAFILRAATKRISM